ncbi:uncharacterized protein J7T54_002391 [Emericellopsis cladophorae]|uniref:T6SS Phospholipase effector Tle1-like catalytic domain-containing protein n=1 Tax=Emericellopsis cladophorae TaxID=2686198 RepID=A0A9P9Y268_9HYPO|nr:uncharacterized protein J7T54_002391 [Emericellopsis cladophorae]KAI6782154.1 hypothetical protein J7T54_002391 [Emericellopsis cladophorae]
MACQASLGKRMILCLDGTWMDSDNGYQKSGLFSSHGTLQVPSNVTRISRCFKRRCSDGRLQIISYESGVGTGSSTFDTITGGAFGLGLSERVREAYSYLCANYMDGDEIFLVGFSRGAFTARSVAGMVSNLGLLTREGVERFYIIFTDMQHWQDDDYDDPYPTVPFPNKPKGPHAAREYRARLEQMGYTRVCQADGRLIKIKGVCVWDTVGSLGIPNITWLERLGIRPTFRWHDTSLNNRIEHAFQALALDETRSPFRPAVWERANDERDPTDLRQVWFPGNHANCGGGWPDQGMANCTLAWMMDQMASVGVEFDHNSLDRVIRRTSEYYETLAETLRGPGPIWAMEPIYENNEPLRPWALGKIAADASILYKLAGETPRTPGMYKQTNPKTQRPTRHFLRDTNERVHSSVRVRLACQGLGLNDNGIWTCAALRRWRLRLTKQTFFDPIPGHPDWQPRERGRWVWEYVGSDREGPPSRRERIMVEEPLGPFERYVLKLSGGYPNVYDFAGRRGPRRLNKRIGR